MTPFRKLAEQIAMKPNEFWFCCRRLPEKEAHYFTDYFRPTSKERKEYRHYKHSWMSAADLQPASSNDLRILALLICEQHYLTYNKP